MPAPDLIDPEVVFDPHEDEPKASADLGANPWCSNCSEELTGPGGILCGQCFERLYITGFRQLDPNDQTLAEVALSTDGIPRHVDGTPWVQAEMEADILQEQIALGLAGDIDQEWYERWLIENEYARGAQAGADRKKARGRRPKGKPAASAEADPAAGEGGHSVRGDASE